MKLPLKEGNSNRAKSKNISELMQAYEQKGSIGNTHPKNKKHALQIAIAIAMDKAKKKS